MALPRLRVSRIIFVPMSCDHIMGLFVGVKIVIVVTDGLCLSLVYALEVYGTP